MKSRIQVIHKKRLFADVWMSAVFCGVGALLINTKSTPVWPLVSRTLNDAIVALIKEKHMNALLNAAIDHIWGQIARLKHLVTPDNAVGRTYTIIDVNPNAVVIKTEAGSQLTIQRAAFIETLRYLIENRHVATCPCEIRSNQLAEQSGPLCAATRAANGNTRVINYIVPILTAVEILECSGSRPNTTWLI